MHFQNVVSYFTFFLLKFATMNEQAWKNMKKFVFAKFISPNLIA